MFQEGILNLWIKKDTPLLKYNFGSTNRCQHHDNKHCWCAGQKANNREEREQANQVCKTRRYLYLGSNQWKKKYFFTLVLVRKSQSNAQLPNLHVEQHRYEQCSILLVIMPNYAMRNTHITLCHCVLLHKKLIFCTIMPNLLCMCYT